MAGAFYGKQIRPEDRTVLDAINDAHEQQFTTLKRKLENEISSFNSLAEKHGHKMRLKYLPDQEMYSGQLVIGRKEQLEFGAYEAILGYGLDTAYSIALSFRIYQCGEFGE